MSLPRSPFMRSPGLRETAKTLIFFLLALAGAALAAADEPLVVGKITIRTVDVYAEHEVEGRATRAANFLHVETREDVIRELLLFHEGDVYEPERLAETERNLRKLKFIRVASVTAGEPHDGRVDVVVVTQDSWSTEPGFAFGSRGGGEKAAVEFTERNLLGRGWDVEYRYEDNPDRTRQAVRFRDPSFFGPYWQSELLFSSNSDGDEKRVRVERPFFSTESPWSLLAGGERVEQVEKLYRFGLEVERFAARHDRFDVGYGLAIAKDVTFAQRLSAGIALQRDRFESLTGFGTTELPADREYRYLWLQYDLVNNDYLKLHYVDRGELPQDFNLGTEISLRVGISPMAFGVDETTGMVAASVARGFGLGRRSILLAEADFASRVGAPDRNMIASTSVSHITRFDTARPQTTVLRLRADRGWDLDRDVQFYADGESGLRGYRLHTFAGDQRVIVTAEHRMFLGREVFKLISPGIVFFIDGGTAIAGSRGIRWSDMNFDAGIGLWLGMSRSGRNVARIDLARAFSEDPLGRSPWIITVSGNRSF